MYWRSRVTTGFIIPWAPAPIHPPAYSSLSKAPWQQNPTIHRGNANPLRLWQQDESHQQNAKDKTLLKVGLIRGLIRYMSETNKNRHFFKTHRDAVSEFYRIHVSATAHWTFKLPVGLQISKAGIHCQTSTAWRCMVVSLSSHNASCIWPFYVQVLLEGLKVRLL